MKYLLRAIGGWRIRPGEGRTVSLLLAHSLGLGFFRAFYLSIANTQFVADFPSRYIPFAFLASGALGYVVLRLFSALEKRVRFVRFLVLDLLFVGLLTASFWLGFELTGSRWVSFAVFAFMGPVSTLVDLEFWGLAGRLLNIRQSKRLFSLIGAGEALASILGFFFVPFLYRWIADPYVLLLLAAAALATCFAVLLATVRRFEERLRGGDRDAAL